MFDVDSVVIFGGPQIFAVIFYDSVVFELVLVDDDSLIVSSYGYDETKDDDSNDVDHDDANVTIHFVNIQKIIFSLLLFEWFVYLLEREDLDNEREPDRCLLEDRLLKSITRIYFIRQFYFVRGVTFAVKLFVSSKTLLQIVELWELVMWVLELGV